MLLKIVYYSLIVSFIINLVARAVFRKKSDGFCSIKETMYGSAKFKSVPIIDVTKENVSAVAPVLRGSIIGADFIAIDCVWL